MADTKLGFFTSMAPQVIRNHIIIGVSGDFYDLNGYIRSYDPETGKEQWQWNSIPTVGEPGSETWPTKGNAIKHGGGMTWMSGTYYPDLNLMYWGIGNPNPTCTAAIVLEITSTPAPSWRSIQIPASYRGISSVSS